VILLNLKKIAGEKAVEHIEAGMVVGLGTGSTAYYAIKKIGDEVKEGLEVTCIATSKATEVIAKECGIPLSSLAEHPDIDVTIDGADEVDPNLNLIKGMGGALVREKIIASASRKVVIVADPSKIVNVLGIRSPLPVEVIPFGVNFCQKQLQKFGCKVEIRKKNNEPFVSDNGNYVVDCFFKKILAPKKLQREINCIPGVVDNGLFLNMADEVIIGTKNGIKKLVR
jgi:ribose 5-phosphate isomerase A